MISLTKLKILLFYARQIAINVMNKEQTINNTNIWCFSSIIFDLKADEINIYRKELFICLSCICHMVCLSYKGPFSRNNSYT